MEFITVALIESNEIQFLSISCVYGGEVNILKRKKWDPRPYLIDSHGQRLIEEIGRRVEVFWKENGRKDNTILLSLPGMLKDEYTLIISSRLGIRQTINLGEAITDLLEIPCYLFNDAECISIGEIKYGNHFENQIPEAVVYVFVDEGVGSKIYINDKLYLGGGSAGILGRLIVNPDGDYLPSLRSNGALEIYCGRPWVSRRLIEVYHSEFDKKNKGHNYDFTEKDNNSKFRQALITAANGEWDRISYDRIAEGVKDCDPIAMQVIERSTKYLGYSLSSIITLINPNSIILGGSMVSKIPNYAEKTIHYTRQFSWPNAWNRTEIKISYNDRDFQVYGVVDLYRSRKLLN